MKKVITLLRKNYHIFFFLFLSSWILLYQRDGFISAGDFTFPVEPARALNIRLFAWKDLYFLWDWSTVDFANIVHYLPIFILYKIGFSINFIQSLFFIYLFFIASYSTFLLLFELLGDFKYKKIVAIASANLYIFNPYVAQLKLSAGYTISMFSYSFAPLILYLFYKYLNTKNYFRNKYFSLLAICFLLITPCVTQPAYLTWIIGILFFYLLFLLLVRVFNKAILYKSFLAVLMFFLINSFWTVPSVSMLSQGRLVENLSGLRGDTSLSSLHSGSGQSLIEVFRFLGNWALVANWRGVPYFPYFLTYFTPIFIIISFILLGTGLSFFLFKWRGEQDKQDVFWASYFFSIFFIAIFFIGGVNFLFPTFKQWLFENISVMLLYRKPYEKIGFFLIFSFVGLLAFSLKKVAFFFGNRLDENKKGFITIFVLSLLLLINIYSFPFWTKRIFSSIKYAECKINSLNYYPDYYYKLAEYFQTDKVIGGVLGLPVSNSPIISGVEVFNWGYGGIDPISNFINSKYLLINPLMAPFKNLYEKTNSNLASIVDYENNLLSFSKLFNIKKIILRNDLCWQFYRSPNPERDKKYLGSFLKKEMSFGELDVFDIPSGYFLPHFYTPQNIIYSPNDIEVLPEIVGLGDYNVRSAIYLGEIGNREIEKLGNSSRKSGTEIIERADGVMVKGEIRNSVAKILKIEKLRNSEVVYPAIKYRPGTWQWRLAILKERYEKWKVRDEAEKLFEKHLFYANKRIAEYLRYADNADEGRVTRMSERYQEEMAGAVEEIEKLGNSSREGGTEIFERMLAKLEGVLERHKIEIKKLGNWEIVFRELEKKAEELEVKRDFEKLVYQIEVPKEGEYEIYLRNLPAAEIEKREIGKLGSSATTEIENKEIGKLESSGWAKWTDKYFEKGTWELVLPFAGISENLIGENLQINDYQPDSIYQINFDYLAPKGGGFFIAEGKEGRTAEISLPTSGEDFRHFEMYFKSSPEAKEGIVHLSISVAEEKNLEVRRVYQPEIMLRSEIGKSGNSSREGGTEIEKLPRITFVKINPTKYRVKVEGAREPYTLVFSESFHEGWKLYVSGNSSREGGTEIVASYFEGEIKEGAHRNIFLDRNTFETWGRKPLAEDKHLLVNGYANSWYITPEDAGASEDYEMIIEFAPQRLFYIGLVISGLTLLGCLGYLGIEKLRNMSR
ncbi:hypothetical protein FJY90_01650 [Candidatus Gottesmanbacteria bacterium]|nr:hypothetical protein [Candidatus Gottesmanbacteria bacterium]